MRGLVHHTCRSLLGGATKPSQKSQGRPQPTENTKGQREAKKIDIIILDNGDAGCEAALHFEYTLKVPFWIFVVVVVVVQSYCRRLTVRFILESRLHARQCINDASIDDEMATRKAFYYD